MHFTVVYRCDMLNIEIEIYLNFHVHRIENAVMITFV